VCQRYPTSPCCHPAKLVPHIKADLVSTPRLVSSVIELLVLGAADNSLAIWPTGHYAVTHLAPQNGPVLAPAAEIGPRRKRRSSASHAPPPLLGSSQRNYHSDLGSMSAPRTPTTAVTPRAGILRMPSQQAEKDAVDTLLFMSSPNNSGRVPHPGIDAQAQPSPLRTEVPARRVMFDHTAQEKYMESHQRKPDAVNGPHAAYYRADYTR
jgi:hypothetical protein